MSKKYRKIEEVIEEEEIPELSEGPEEPGGGRRGSILPWVLIIVLPCYLADQLTKWLVCRTMEIGTGFNVIPGFFDIIHVRNTGAAFGMLQGIPTPVRTWFFLGVTIVAFIAIFVMFIRIKEKSWLLKLVFCLIVAGAMGNLTDRFSYSEVVDFLSVYVGRFRWPAFNLADIYITIGMLGLIIHIMTAPKEE
ncbi:signal peptidase II [archaeon]|nr:signal peptidase II [archaeon]